MRLIGPIGRVAWAGDSILSKLGACRASGVRGLWREAFCVLILLFFASSSVAQVAGGAADEDGRLFLIFPAGDGALTVAIADHYSGGVESLLPVRGAPANITAAATGEEFAAAGTADGEILLLSVLSAEINRRFPGQGEPVLGVAVSPEEGYLGVVTSRRIRLFDIEGEAAIADFTPITGQFTGAVAASDEWLLAGTDDGAIHIYHLEGVARYGTVTMAGAPVTALAIAREEQADVFAAGDAEGNVRTYDARTGGLLSTVPQDSPRGAIRHLAVSFEGTVMAIAPQRGPALVAETMSGSLLGRLRIPGENVLGMSGGPEDTDTLIIITTERNLVLVDGLHANERVRSPLTFR